MRQAPLAPDCALCGSPTGLAKTALCSNFVALELVALVPVADEPRGNRITLYLGFLELIFRRNDSLHLGTSGQRVQLSLNGFSVFIIIFDNQHWPG